MNYIQIIEPRWHDMTVLVADYKIGKVNQIKIGYKDKYPDPFYMTGEQLRTYPTTTVKSMKGKEILMRCVPLAELSTDLILEEL